MNSKAKGRLLKDILAVCVPVCLLVIYYLYMEKYSVGYLNSDMSSELMLSRLLAAHHEILCRDWYYSTELRVLNTQLIFAPLFRVFTSYHTVRVVGSTLLLAILFLNAYFFGRAYGLNLYKSSLLGSLLLLPYWGAGYFPSVLRGVYYVLPLPILIQYNDSLIKERELWLKAAAILFCVLFTVCGTKNYQDATLDLTEEKRKVTAAVMEHDCRYGYASFWNGNVLTELSEGEIEVHVWGDNISEIEEINQTYQWLQIKSHESEAPEGKVFCLFDYEQFSCPLASKMDPGKLIYQSEEYKLYLYDSYDQLNQTVSDKWR